MGFAVGAADYLIKPIRKPVLLETVRRHVLPHDDDDATILLVDDDPKNIGVVGRNPAVRRIRDSERAERGESAGSALL